MDLRAYVAALRKHWITFVVGAGVVLAAGLPLVLSQPLQYVSSAQLLVTIDGATTASAYRNDDAVAARINTYIPLLTSSTVTRPVQQKLGLRFSDSEMASRISATRVPPRTALIDVQATGDSATEAQTLAQTLAEQFVVYTEAIETGTGEDDQRIHTQVVSKASDARDDRLVHIMLAGLVTVAALLIGAAAVWFRSARQHVQVQVQVPTSDRRRQAPS